MANVAMMGWDAEGKVWRKVLVNTEGKLIIDPSEILEDDPTDGEVGKAPTSNWAHDHAALPAVHHARYTDAESRAAIGNILSSTGYMQAVLNCNYFEVWRIKKFYIRWSEASTRWVWIISTLNSTDLCIYGGDSVLGMVAAVFKVYDGTAYQVVATEPVVDTKITTHAAIAAAHHARYTDAEAVAAVGYGGTKYWSCGGSHFDGVNPAVNTITKGVNGSLWVNANNINLVGQVLLPHGAVVTSVIVRGNAGAEGETWTMWQTRLSDLNGTSMATARVNTADTTINVPTIDNSLYTYFLYILSLNIDDEIWGATITYTL